MSDNIAKKSGSDVPVDVEQLDRAITTDYTESTDTTWKTWVVIFVLASSVGVSFWPVPTTSPMLATIAAQFNNPTSSSWYLSSFTTGASFYACCALGFLISGTNSDLFGRRIVILVGNILSALGSILCATSHNYHQFIAGMAILGFASGMSQLGLISVPELLPNKYRHIGIVLSDGILFPILVCAPIVGNYAVKDPTTRNWTYIYYGQFAAMILTFVAVFFLYEPPKRPRGVSWKEALRGLDYVGMVLVTGGVLLTLMGIVYTTYLPATSAFVLGPLCSGIVLLVIFGVWENVSSVPYKLCPPAIFSHHWGRSFSVPFVFGAIITMYYYAANIMWPTMIAMFYVAPDASINDTLILTLPANLGLVGGALLFAVTGHHIKHWKLTLIISFTLAVLFGGLMAMVTPYNKKLMLAFVFLMQFTFGWAQYEAVMFVQFGVDQLNLGASGGLAGVARFGGGSLAVSVYTSVLTNSQTKKALDIVVKAGTENGLTVAAAKQLLAALSLGADAVAAVPGINPTVIAAASAAFLESYAYGLKMTALCSVGFGSFGIILCLLCEDPTPKMTNQTNIFLENDINADKNKFH